MQPGWEFGRHGGSSCITQLKLPGGGVGQGRKYTSWESAQGMCKAGLQW